MLNSTASCGLTLGGIDEDARAHRERRVRTRPSRRMGATCDRHLGAGAVLQPDGTLVRLGGLQRLSGHARNNRLARLSLW